MVKRVLSVNRTGFRDWLIQRISALYMAFFVLFFGAYIFANAPFSFEQWTFIFSMPWMKVATLIFIFLMLWHSWIGLWTITTDYVQCKKIRALIYLFSLLMLVGGFLYSCLILFSMNN